MAEMEMELKTDEDIDPTNLAKHIDLAVISDIASLGPHAVEETQTKVVDMKISVVVGELELITPHHEGKVEAVEVTVFEF
jgi:hypothetical protein